MGVFRAALTGVFGVLAAFLGAIIGAVLALVVAFWLGSGSATGMIVLAVFFFLLWAPLGAILAVWLLVLLADDYSPPSGPFSRPS